MKKYFKGLWADIKVFVLNSWIHSKFWLKDLSADLKVPENYDLRLFVFVFIYLLFSLVGMYNFAHLTAFFYIIWLLERNVLGR
jgi:hypothetical protein